MTKDELIYLLRTQGNCFRFTYRGEVYGFGFIPSGKDESVLREWIIGRENDTNEEIFDSLAEMLGGYCINGVPLLKLLPEIHDMRGIPTA